MTLDDLRAEFPGYHIEIELYPSGGSISVNGCEDCGTDKEKFNSTIWTNGKPGLSLEDAINTLQHRLGLTPNAGGNSPPRGEDGGEERRIVGGRVDRNVRG